MTSRWRADPAEDKAREPADLEAEAQKVLSCEAKERFVCAYAASFDGPASAREAGYGKDAEAIWKELLDCPKVQARLRALRQGPHVPAQDQRGVLADFLLQSFWDDTNLFVQDPITGERRLELSRATPDQLNRLKIRTTTTRQGSITRITTIVKTP